MSALPTWAKVAATGVIAIGCAGAWAAVWMAVDSRGLRHALRVCRLLRDDLCDRCEERRRRTRIDRGATSALHYAGRGTSPVSFGDML